jgi:hypothetical protein
VVVEGRVERKQVARASKSSREAVVLVTAGGEYVLRRAGANAFADPELETLVGQQIRAEGTLHGYTFLMTHWQVTA